MGWLAARAAGSAAAAAAATASSGNDHLPRWSGDYGEPAVPGPAATATAAAATSGADTGARPLSQVTMTKNWGGAKAPPLFFWFLL